MTEPIDAATVEALETPAASDAGLARARQGYFAIALLIAVIVTWGFWETYYSRLSERADLPSIVHWHAAVFSVWVLLLVAQAAAVVTGRIRAHRRLGLVGMGYGAVVFAIGLLVSIGAPALRVRDGQFPLDVGGLIVLYNLADMLLFGLIGSNFNALAMEPLGHVAGTASSVLGFTQTFGGGIIGTVIGQAFDGTVTPLAAGFCCVSIVAFAMVAIAERGKLFQPHNPAV